MSFYGKLMRQDSFSDAGFEKYRKKTRKEQFLEEMETIIPWKELTAVLCTSSKDMAPIGPFSKRHFSAGCFSSLTC